jgi:hypothetical protein
MYTGLTCCCDSIHGKKKERFTGRNTPVDRAGTALLDWLFPLGVRESFDQ